MNKTLKSVKRVSRIACAVIIMAIILPTAFAFADATTDAALTSGTISGDHSNSAPLKLVDNFPYNGDTKFSVDTVGIKLYFDKPFKTSDVKDMFKFSGKKSEKISTKAYVNKKNPTYILVTATKKKGGNDVSLDPKSDYRLTISGKLTSIDGNALGEDKVINFRTIDTTGNSKIYMLLMVAMIGGMIVMTVFSNKRKARAKAAAESFKPVNPYKLARDKGITVQEATALVEKEKLKHEKRMKAAGIDPAALAAPKETKPKGHRVKGPRPISAGGSSYKTGRKALAEKRAKEAAAKRALGTTNPKNRKGKNNRKK